MNQASFIFRLLRRIGRKIVRPFDNLSIRSKLFVYAALLVGLMLILAGVVSYRVSEIRNRYMPARMAARDMEASLLAMRIHELNFTDEADSLNAEFYLKQQSAQVDAWQNSYRQFETSYAVLTNFFPDGDIKKQLDSIQPMMTKYRDTFLALTGVYRERGYQSFGREGVLRERAETLRANLTSVSLQNTFLKMQNAQDRFLLYHDMSSVSAFHDNATQLRGQLSTNDRTTFDEYTRLFDEMVGLYQKIGLTNTGGLRSQLTQQTTAITPYITEIGTSVIDLTSNYTQMIIRSINITTILVAVVAMLVAFVLSRLIIKKIRLLSQASARIANGDFRYRLPVTAQDELGKLAGSFNDMTERLQKNQQVLHERAHELSQSVKRSELVSRAVREAVYEWNFKTGHIVWGEGIVSLFGYLPEDRNSTFEWWGEHVHPDDADAINAALEERVRRQAESWKKEYRFKKASGEYIYCQDRGFIEYQKGKAVRMVGSIVDISRQKALDQAKDSFISVASHQLRTPLGSIRWNLELLLEEVKSLPKDIAGYASEAYNSTLRMAGLVNDLLSVARIEQGRVQHIPEKTNLATIIKEAMGEMQPIAKRHNVTIASIKVRGKQPDVVIDPKRFREVVQNLLSNAVKYTPAKGTVTTTVQSREKDFVVSIADNGIGIPLEDQQKLFGKFFRATNVLATDTEGSGLGLFVVRSYVEAWGGKVWFESKVNVGTTFYISIPHNPRAPKVNHNQ